MRATAAYIQSERHHDIPAKEKHSRELQDALLRCLPLLHRTAYRYLDNAADAEEAVQDALLSAYKHLDQFRGQARMSTWLVAIVANCARMQLRRRPRQMHLSLDAKLGDDEGYTVSERMVDYTLSPEEQYRKLELHELLVQFAEKLSPPLRRAFQLCDLDGLTTSEAAHILGVVDGTVKAQLARARERLTRLFRQALDAQPRASLAYVPSPCAEAK